MSLSSKHPILKPERRGTHPKLELEERSSNFKPSTIKTLRPATRIILFKVLELKAYKVWVLNEIVLGN